MHPPSYPLRHHIPPSRKDRGVTPADTMEPAESAPSGLGARFRASTLFGRATTEKGSWVAISFSICRGKSYGSTRRDQRIEASRGRLDARLPFSRLSDTCGGCGLRRRREDRTDERGPGQSFPGSMSGIEAALSEGAAAGVPGPAGAPESLLGPRASLPTHFVEKYAIVFAVVSPACVVSHGPSACLTGR
jgi:hypothetical protein